VASFEVFPGNAAYCASKFGALGLTRVLREELRASKIRVTALMPGPTDTSLWEGYWPDAPREAMMQPDDVARVVLAAIAGEPKAVMEEIVLRPIVGRI
jgi:short-subunit dehydrogenase